MSRVALFALMIVAGCAAGGMSGDPCGGGSNCRDGLVCVSGFCSEPCPSSAPARCGTYGEYCCPSAFPFCCDGDDASCYADPVDCEGCAGLSCTSSAFCCEGYTCSRYGKKCQAAKNLPIGEPCEKDSQCSSGKCDPSGYCTKRCTATSQCGAANYCLNTGAGFHCVPFCTSDAGCSVFDFAWCQTAPDPNGLMLKGCFGF